MLPRFGLIGGGIGVGTILACLGYAGLEQLHFSSFMLWLSLTAGFWCVGLGALLYGHTCSFPTNAKKEQRPWWYYFVSPLYASGLLLFGEGPVMKAVALGNFFFFMAVEGFYTLFYFEMTEAGLSPSALTVWMGFHGGLLAISQIVSSYWVAKGPDRTYPRRELGALCAGLLLSGTTLGFGVFSTYSSAIAVALVFGLSAGIVYSPLLAATSRISGEHIQGEALAGLRVIGVMAEMSGQQITTRLWSIQLQYLAWCFMGLSMFVAFALVVRIWWREEHEDKEEERQVLLPKKKAVAVVGVAACGKSTWARSFRRSRVHVVELRALLSSAAGGLEAFLKCSLAERERLHDVAIASLQQYQDRKQVDVVLVTHMTLRVPPAPGQPSKEDLVLIKVMQKEDVALFSHVVLLSPQASVVVERAQQDQKERDIARTDVATLPMAEKRLKEEKDEAVRWCTKHGKVLEIVDNVEELSVAVDRCLEKE